MAFEPDIIGRNEETSRTLFVAAVEAYPQDPDESVRGLKAYMDSRNIEIGLLVTPERLWLYHNRYLPSDNPIEEVGQFDVKNIFRFRGTGDVKEDEFEFERRVQYWLDDLTESSPLPPALRIAAERYLIPVISDGLLGATHPRVVFSA